MISFSVIVKAPISSLNLTISGSSASFNGRGFLSFNTGTGSETSTYDLEASYEEKILMYIRPTDTDTSSVLFQMS